MPKRRFEWSLFRLWNFLREPNAFDLHQPPEPHVSLTTTSVLADFLSAP